MRRGWGGGTVIIMNVVQVLSVSRFFPLLSPAIPTSSKPKLNGGDLGEMGIPFLSALFVCWARSVDVRGDDDHGGEYFPTTPDHLSTFPIVSESADPFSLDGRRRRR